MKDAQKQNIQDMRLQGIAYSQIADSLSLSVNTVKSFCRRNSHNIRSTSNDDAENKDTCRQCGKKLAQISKRKPKTFCGDACRYAWWNMHRSQSSRKSMNPAVCVYCGKSFDSYGRKDKKYCAHGCYVKHRFGGEARHEQRTV